MLAIPMQSYVIKCFFFNLASFQGPTPSNYTGPDGAYNGDIYMYAEASTPRVEGNRAVLQSDLFFPG